jgi:hypothetical protein
MRFVELFAVVLEVCDIGCSGKSLLELEAVGLLFRCHLGTLTFCLISPVSFTAKTAGSSYTKPQKRSLSSASCRYIFDMYINAITEKFHIVSLAQLGERQTEVISH